MHHSDNKTLISGDYIGRDKLIAGDEVFQKIVQNITHITNITNVINHPVTVYEHPYLAERQEKRERIELTLPHDLSNISADRVNAAIADARIALARGLGLLPEEIEVMLVSLGSLQVLFRMPTDSATMLAKKWDKHILASFAPVVRGGDARMRFILEDLNLRGANLLWANLSEACLTEADLTSASLIGANLFRANLVRANLHNADLFGADLRQADLGGANLVGANLTKARLEDANLQDTCFSDHDVSHVKYQYNPINLKNLKSPDQYRIENNRQRKSSDTHHLDDSQNDDLLKWLRHDDATSHHTGEDDQRHPK
ncbi:MAG: pentapeptide repeat-containing protein [Chloroflexota bacterium]